MAFGLAILIPIIAIILLTQIGLDIISDKLAIVNEITQTVEIHDPTTGEVTPIDVKSAWPLLILHIFGVLSQYPVYDVARNTPWYQFGFLIGAGSPILGFIRGR